ncbi:MAG: hypothetical protein J5674_01090, partial [Candidatus Methanomethylophilaceae archaeon]|nr:hypothetical protein [Candidatus Methanomethylophilaceae archaeon]
MALTSSLDSFLYPPPVIVVASTSSSSMSSVTPRSRTLVTTPISLIHSSMRSRPSSAMRLS